MINPKRKKCWLCERARAAKFFPAHNKVSKVDDVTIRQPLARKQQEFNVYAHVTLRLEPQAAGPKHICDDCLYDVREIMLGAIQ